MDGAYGEKDIYIGSPAVVNREGIKSIIEIPLNDLEKQKMHESVSTIRLMQEDAFKNLL